MTSQINPHLRHDFPRRRPLRTLYLRLVWWLTHRLLQSPPPSLEAEINALRWLVGGLTLIVVVETVMLIVAAQAGFVR